MSFLRLGTKCVVTDSTGRVLLSKREDLGFWNVPGGRLDSGEPITQAAAREVLEETGVAVEIMHPVGLYYWQGWERMNVVFAAKPIGGRLRRQTDETSDNRYFSPDSPPANFPGPDYIGHTLSGYGLPPQIVQLAHSDLLKIQLRLRWRWVKNLLRGRPEPRFTQFNILAAAAVFSNDHQHILTLPDGAMRTLPRVRCDGKTAPWIQLAEHLKQFQREAVSLSWVGLWQETVTDTLEFVFAATVPESSPLGWSEWTQAQNVPLSGRESSYLERTPAEYRSAPVWVVISPTPYATIIPV